MRREKERMGEKKMRDSRGEWILETEGICYTYEGNSRKALDQVSLRIRRGRKTAIMGGNGSGKSTLFLCLNGILKPQAGNVLLDGRPVGYRRKELLELRRRVGIVFQDPDDQLFSASVRQEISFGILNLGADEAQAAREVDRVIEGLGITPFRDRPAHALSGGQKKLVAIADILVMRPEVMILDEPAAFLDPKHRKIVRSVVEKLSGEGMTLVMSTHDVDDAYAWADEVILMEGGRVLRQGTPEEVLSDAEAVARADLELPAVLRMCRSLQARGILAPGPEPRTMEELERRITG